MGLVPSSTSPALPISSSTIHSHSLIPHRHRSHRVVPTAAGEGEGEGEWGAEMVVRIRLARFGCRNRPFYRLMAADSRSPRDGKHLELLGYYNPIPGKDGGKRMGLKFDRVKYWLSIGAQPSDPVERILFRAGILPPPPVLAMAHKGGPRDRHPIDPMTGRPLDIEDLTIVDDPSTPLSENGEVA